MSRGGPQHLRQIHQQQQNATQKQKQQQTLNQTIRYFRDSQENFNVLWGWVDANWAGDTDTRRSHTGYILMMNGDPISW